MSGQTQQISGYELIHEIGAGNYGTVWLARGVTGGLRAVKIVQRDWFRSDVPYEREFAGIRRFAEVSLREPRQLALLNVGRDDAAGFFYYVIELADPVVHQPPFQEESRLLGCLLPTDAPLDGFAGATPVPSPWRDTARG